MIQEVIKIMLKHNPPHPVTRYPQFSQTGILNAMQDYANIESRKKSLSFWQWVEKSCSLFSSTDGVDYFLIKDSPCNTYNHTREELYDYFISFVYNK